MDLSGVEAILYAVLAFSLGLYPVGILLPCSECCEPGIESDTFCRCLRYELVDPGPPRCDDIWLRGSSASVISTRAAGFLKRCRKMPIYARYKRSDLRFNTSSIRRPLFYLSNNGEILSPRIRTAGEELSAGEEAVHIVELFPSFRNTPLRSSPGIHGNESPFCDNYYADGPGGPVFEDPAPGDRSETAAYTITATIVGVSLPLLLDDEIDSLNLTGPGQQESFDKELKKVSVGLAEGSIDSGINVRTQVSDIQIVDAGLEVLTAGYDQYFDGTQITSQSLAGMASIEVAETVSPYSTGEQRTYTATLTFTPTISLSEYLPNDFNFPGRYAARVIYVIKHTHGDLEEYWTWSVRIRRISGTAEELPAEGLPPLEVGIPNVPSSVETITDSVTTSVSGEQVAIRYTMGNNEIAEDEEYINAPVYQYVPDEEQLRWKDVSVVASDYNLVLALGTSQNAIQPWSPECTEQGRVWAAGCANQPPFPFRVRPKWVFDEIVTDANELVGLLGGSGSVSFTAKYSDEERQIRVRAEDRSPLCGKSINAFSAGGTSLFGQSGLPTELDVVFDAYPLVATAPRGAVPGFFGCQYPGVQVGMTYLDNGYYGWHQVCDEGAGGAYRPFSEEPINVFCGDALWAIDNGPCRTSQWGDCNSLYPGTVLSVSQEQPPTPGWCYKGYDLFTGGDNIETLTSTGGKCPKPEVTISIGNLRDAPETSECFGSPYCWGWNSPGSELPESATLQNLNAEGDFVAQLQEIGCDYVRYRSSLDLGGNNFITAGLRHLRDEGCRYPSPTFGPDGGPTCDQVFAAGVGFFEDGRSFGLSTTNNFGLPWHCDTRFYAKKIGEYESDGELLPICGPPFDNPCPIPDGYVAGDTAVHQTFVLPLGGGVWVSHYMLASISHDYEEIDAIYPSIVNAPESLDPDGQPVTLTYQFPGEDPQDWLTPGVNLNAYPGEVQHKFAYLQIRRFDSRLAGGFAVHKIPQPMRNPPILSDLITIGSVFDGGRAREITVPQAGEDGSRWFLFKAPGNPFDPGVTVLDGLCISTQDSWLAINALSGRGIGNDFDRFELVAEANDTGQERTGTVTISWGDWEETWTVTQEA